jgi:sugar O-acyltransferase (sialic acid O-acetyltransferase NeuD family)
MKNLIIIGAGGMGRSYFDLAKESKGYGVEFRIKGFIDDDLMVLNGFKNYPALLGKICDYEPEFNDVFISSIGGAARIICCETIAQRGGKFINLIHNTARIGTNVSLGYGNLIAAYVALGADSKIGNFNMIQSYSVIGHDTLISNFVRIDTHVICVGGTKIYDKATIHSNSVINHKVIINSGATVGAQSFVIRSVPEGETVFGTPARKL